MVKNGLQLSLDKCIYGVTEIKYLGYLIDTDRVQKNIGYLKERNRIYCRSTYTEFRAISYRDKKIINCIRLIIIINNTDSL